MLSQSLENILSESWTTAEIAKLTKLVAYKLDEKQRCVMPQVNSCFQELG